VLYKNLIYKIRKGGNLW